jgi:diguanylate cyclase (GGDEF)-like protein
MAMPLNKIVFRKKSAISASICISFFILTIFLIVIWMLFNSNKQREILDTTDKFMTFESQVERLVYSNITLLQGYEAYIKSNPNLDEKSAYDYLENLLSKNSNYIRNIGVIKDTTIIWNYPKATNTAAIGVDLAKIDKQKDLVLKVKEDLTTVFQGPVDLIQGGTGFIVRIPIVRQEDYWGQISIVLLGDKVIDDINTYAANSGLNVAIFNSENETAPFCGSVNSVGKSPLIFEIDPTLINWKVYVSPNNGWKNNMFEVSISILFAISISVFVGIASFRLMKTNHQLLNMSTHDSLSGLFNRHFLEEYQKSVLLSAKKSNYKVGIISLDLNHFKKINDTYGHSVGDLVLIETSRILKAIMCTNDAVFRLGGDEFLIILPNIEGKATLQLFKERLLKRFEEDFCIVDYPIKMSLSIGCAMFPDDGDDIDVLLQIADSQMYIDKDKFKM